MMMHLLLLALGLALIVKGGDWFVSSAVRIAELLRMPRVVMGSTLVSLATTTPELVVSILAGLRHEPGLAVGNAVGSCICNIGLILGLSAALKRVELHPKVLRVPLFVMLGLGGLLLALTFDLRVSRAQGAVLIAVGLVYFVFDFIRHKRAAGPSEVAEAAAIGEEHIGGSAWLRRGWGAAAQFAAGAVLVVAGSRLLVDAAVQIAAALGVPSIIIGLTVVAVGTSLPELVTAITSARKNVSDLAVGNVLGANIANMTLIVGTAAAINDVDMSRFTQRFNFPAMLALMGLLAGMIHARSGLAPRQGKILLGYYGLYVSVLVVLTLMQRS